MIFFSRRLKWLTEVVLRVHIAAHLTEVGVHQTVLAKHTHQQELIKKLGKVLVDTQKLEMQMEVLA